MDEHESESNYEISDANPATLVIWGVGLLSMVLLSIGAAWVFFDVLTAVAERGDRKPSPLATNEPPPAPRLLSNEPADLAAVRKEEEEILDSYGWVDRERGIVRIPIEDAMSRVVKEAPKRSEAGPSS